MESIEQFIKTEGSIGSIDLEKEIKNKIKNEAPNFSKVINNILKSIDWFNIANAKRYYDIIRHICRFNMWVEVDGFLEICYQVS